MPASIANITHGSLVVVFCLIVISMGIVEAQELWRDGKRASEEDRFRFGGPNMGSSQFRFRARRNAPEIGAGSSQITKEQLNQVESILENMIDFLRDVGRQFSTDNSITRGKKSLPDDSPGFPMDMDSLDPGFVQVRPSREGRRYLLWRKITG
ncbi:hypothetical protein TCAL_15321 [Tigriopus californicus]|uniref:Uncharacterized protein n=1 Tax=Tigriopus californicus TaxID=6832 RepID=A0A553PM87_TIGCA|nr:hypothetical protein TCAL_15321 [Tigriopus californicus]